MDREQRHGKQGTHVSEEHHDPRRYPRPRRENPVPKEVSATPRSRLREGTAGPRALMNIPSKVNDPNRTREGNNRAETLLLPRHSIETMAHWKVRGECAALGLKTDPAVIDAAAKRHLPATRTRSEAKYSGKGVRSPQVRDKKAAVAAVDHVCDIPKRTHTFSGAGVEKARGTTTSSSSPRTPAYS